jgi:hypothetical protein
MSECIKKEILKIFRCTTFLPNVPKERAHHPKVIGILKKLIKTVSKISSPSGRKTHCASIMIINQ